MSRRAIGLCLGLVCMAWGFSVEAQKQQPSATQTAPANQAEPEPPAASGEGSDSSTGPAATTAEAPPATASEPAKPRSGPSAKEQAQALEREYRGIFAIQRRFVLKRHRVEIFPTYNLSISNTLIRHHGFGGMINIYLSEALFIGLEGTYYADQLLNRYYLLGANERTIPSVNRYRWSGFLEFGYIPISGKFTVFNRAIGHWELWIAGGVGVVRSEVIPRDNNPGNAASEPFSNYLVSGLLPAVGARLWLARWLAFDAYVKNYIFADRLEPANRQPTETADQARQRAVSQFTLDVNFGVGFSIFLPPRFEYRTPR